MTPLRDQFAPDNPTVFGLPRGTWMVLAACLLFALGGMGISIAGRSIPATELIFLRSLSGIPLFLLMIRRAGHSLTGGRTGLLILRGLVMVVGFWLTTRTYMMLPIADAAIIMHIYPVIVIILAGLFFGERAGVRAFVCAAVCIAGVALCAKPSFLFGDAARLGPVGVAFGMMSAVSISVSILLLKPLSRSYASPVLVVWPMVFALFLTPLAGVSDWTLPSGGVQWAGLLLACFGTNFAQFALVDGISREPVGRGAVLTYVELPLTALLGAAFLGDSYDAFTFVGALLVAGGTLALNPAVMSYAGRLAFMRPKRNIS